MDLLPGWSYSLAQILKYNYDALAGQSHYEVIMYWAYSLLHTPHCYSTVLNWLILQSLKFLSHVQNHLSGTSPLAFWPRNWTLIGEHCSRVFPVNTINVSFYCGKTMLEILLYAECNQSRILLHWHHSTIVLTDRCSTTNQSCIRPICK